MILNTEGNIYGNFKVFWKKCPTLRDNRLHVFLICGADLKRVSKIETVVEVEGGDQEEGGDHDTEKLAGGGDRPRLTNG